MAPGEDDRPDRPETTGPADSLDALGTSGPRDHAWRSNPTDDDVDAAFADIVSGIITDSVRRHPSGTLDLPDPGPGQPDRALDPQRDAAAERARRRELRRLERAAELAAFQASEAEAEAEREADQEHFTPPEPPPLPRPRLRTVGAVLMIVGGILLLARPGILAVAPDLAMIMAVLLIVGGATLLVTGIWRHRRSNGDSRDDGAVV